MTKEFNLRTIKEIMKEIADTYELLGKLYGELEKS